MIDQPLIEQSDWLTVAEAVELTGNSKDHILQLIQSGKIQTRRRTQSVLVKRTALLAAQRQQSESTQSLYPSQAALAAIERRSLLEQQQRNAQAIHLLTDWINATGEEARDQYDTLAYLLEHLDEHRAAYREIFPPELKQQLQQALEANQ